MSDDEGTRAAERVSIFNRLGSDYDAGAGAFAHFGRRLVALAGVEPGQHVLDVATGRGAVLFPAAERVGAAGEVVGVDLAEGMVQATNEEAARRGVAARVHVMDAEHLDFPDAAFDRVFCAFGIMFFPHQDRALGEFRRVLKPGGRLGVSTWQTGQSDELVAVLRDLGLEGAQPPGWITEPDDLMRLLQQAGFTDVRVVADSETFRHADLDHYWQTARGTGTRRRLDALDVAQTERVRATLAERLQAQQRPDGIHVVSTALLAIACR
jgi:ubiquinone/menaquinone biosynthesis C-methylase UbiE